jgi:hypothetical protein
MRPLPALTAGSMLRQTVAYAAFFAASVATTPLPAEAQCAFDRPNGSSGSTATLTTSLVRAFVSCGNVGGNAPNATSAGGLPTCQPVETFHEQSGSPANGWQFHEGTSYGRVYVKRSSGGPNLGFPPTLHDATITLKLYHIGNESGGGFASGNGRILVLLRATFDDYVSGDMTAIDFPLTFSFTLTGSGSVSISKKVGDVLATISQPRFPDCTTLEIVTVRVSDPNSNVFAVPGVRY